MLQPKNSGAYEIRVFKFLRSKRWELKFLTWSNCLTVVVAQMAQLSLPAPEILRSNPTIDKFICSSVFIKFTCLSIALKVKIIGSED